MQSTYFDSGKQWGRRGCMERHDSFNPTNHSITSNDQTLRWNGTLLEVNEQGLQYKIPFWIRKIEITLTY